MLILNLLKKQIVNNPKIHFWARVLNRCKSSDFREYVIKFDTPDSLIVCHYGDLFPEKLVYLIDNYSEAPKAGFFAEVSFTLKYLAFAERYHLTPVISWRRESPYKENIPINGTDNMFEYYFIPVSEITEKQVKKCKNVVIQELGQKKIVSNDKGEESHYKEYEELRLLYGHIYNKYFKLNETTRKYVYGNINKIMACGDRFLGVHIRGTDFKNDFNGHPVHVGIDEYVEPARRIFSEYKCNKIFLATDSEEAIELFKKNFSNNLTYYDIRRSDGNIGLHCLDSERINHHYMLGLEVLRDAYTLAQCDCLLAGMSQVSLAAQYINIANNKKHEHIEIINHGINHNERRAQEFMETR